ncbi:hypothetical protein [Streptomyces pilosus]|uniref:Uncharacterized protein n=1 Tax=Streptomyces pilosus TaxID=28893 RepID=A0A918BSX8_9ACTN|nr:hypothetical protein [Streptomyces pilosus]GGQ90804.1 hypothetical protein GCM10010280_43030 [Streptomyces pilosus]GGV58191.1 hypothetical protein GCM10010261_44600 [Streptomyces pilosus]
MGTRTADGTGAAAERDETAVDATETDGATEKETGPATEPEAEPEAEPVATGAGEGPSGVGQGAAAVVSAALGLVSLTGSWLGTVAAARETLVGQLEVTADAGVATQVEEMYGDAWNTSAMWGGVFALTALVVGALVLARPAFGAPARAVQAPWIKSVAWAGVTLGVIGLLLAVLKYTGVLLGLPDAG